MPYNQERSLIQRIKTDNNFRIEIMNITNVKDRINRIRQKGYECSVDSIKLFQNEIQNLENNPSSKIHAGYTKRCKCDC